MLYGGPVCHKGKTRLDMMLHSTGETADLAANSFLPAGRWDFVITPGAARKQARINLLHGEDILLHIKVQPERERMVLNDRIGGRWGSEIHIPAPPSVTAADMHVRLRQQQDELRVELIGGGSAIFPRGIQEMLQARLTFAPGVRLIHDPTGLDPSIVAGRIVRADLMHIVGTLRFPDLRWCGSQDRNEARLVALIDGRIAGRAALPDVAADRLMPSLEFLLHIDDGAFACDGMQADLALEVGGLRSLLASATLKTRFAGGVERCNENMVSGFVCNPDLPGRPALVDVFINDVFQATVPALEPRPDLEVLGLSPECGGFRFRYANPIHLPVSADALISVRVHNTDIELAHSPWRVSHAVCMTRNLAGPCPEVAHEQGAV